MEPAASAFLEELLTTPSPSGYEERIQSAVKRYASAFADEIRLDVHGNLIACANPGGSLRVMLAGHCDQIGMLVTHVDEQGFIYAQTIGGWDSQQLIGQQMTIWSAAGPVSAVISRKAIHLLSDEEKKQAVRLEDLWLDIGARGKEEALGAVRIGDPITLRLGMTRMRNNLACAPGMDDRTGVWVVFEALRRAAARQVRCALFAVSTVQEEIGLRGAQTSAFGIDPHVAIAVDVTHATDCPTIDKRPRGEIVLGKGPVVFRGPNMNHQVTERLLGIARERQLPHQLASIGRATPNDANVLQISRKGVATGLVAIPNRYMHSAVEMVSLDDIDRAAELLAEFVVSLAGDEDFTPR